MSKAAYYAVIFTSKKRLSTEGYEEMASWMERLGSEQPGFMGMESVRSKEGFGITVSYWKTLEDVIKWKAHAEHLKAQRKGKAEWYSGYKVRICKVERQYQFGDI